MALMIMLVLGATTAALVLQGTSNQRNALQSAGARQAFALAEAALAYGEGAVYAAGQSGRTPPTTAQTIPSQSGGGVGTWTASVAADGTTWTITATGTVDGVSRTITAVATTPSTTTVTDQGVWNYLYADSTAGHTNNSCETTINGGTTTLVPVLVRDNLCISGGAHFVGAQLKVGGSLTVNGGANIGASAAKIALLEVAGACTNNGVRATAGIGVCNGSSSPIWASSATSTLDVTPQMPAVSLPTQHDAQNTMARTGCPANLPDNDTVLNNSLGAATLTGAMFGTTAYDCKVGPNEIKWTPSSSCGSATLAVRGTLYFDGSLNVGCGWTITYSGQATLYFTGSVTIQGGVKFCGISGCTTSWNPDQNGIILVAGCWANSTGSSLVSSSCVHFTGGAAVQAGAYATTQYTIDGGATNMGPVLANTLSLSGGGNSLIPFHTMPPGTPLNTRTVNVPAKPPTSWSG
jgi:Tfp pilus assembly protein PilX